MKRILLLLFCAVSLTASAQNYAWSGSFVFDSTTADTTFIWATSFKDKPWSLEAQYQTLDTTNVKFAVVVANTNNGSFSYYPFPGVTFPVTINPVADLYRDENGVIHASRTYQDDHMTWVKFGIMLIKTNYRSGSVNYYFKQ